MINFILQKIYDGYHLDHLVTPKLLENGSRKFILDNIIQFSRFLIDSKVNFHLKVTFQDLKFELNSSKPVEYTNRHDDRFFTKYKTNKKTTLQKVRDMK